MTPAHDDIVARPSFPLKDSDPPSHMWTIAAMLRRRHGQTVIAEWLEKYAEEFHSHSALLLSYAERIKELEEALVEADTELNVTDEELLRIRNECERSDSNVVIWARMVQKLVDHARAIRTIRHSRLEKMK